MAHITLPEMPKGKEFEEEVSALFQSAGFFIERNIKEKDVEEVLELDLIATNYWLSPPDIKLIEVKSGDWGFPDIFKVKGWMEYLNISNGLFIVKEEKPKFDFYQRKIAHLNIDLRKIRESQIEEGLQDIFVAKPNKIDIVNWRFSYWIERNLLALLKHKKKSQKDQERFRVMEDYYEKINSDLFFTEIISARLHELYSTFQRYPRISAKCGNEMLGNPFDAEYDLLPRDIYADTYYSCALNDIQISTFIEHKSRLAVLKNAVDYKLYREAGMKNKTEWILKIMGQEIDMGGNLPASFLTGLETVSRHPFFFLYPIFWQWFMFLFGGFILKDYEEQEYKMLSEKTNIPIDEIPNALSVYDILFPRDGGWFMDLLATSNVNVRLLRMFPVPFMGVGANYRRMLYTDTAKYEELKLTGAYTHKEIVKWNNLAVEVLSRE